MDISHLNKLMTRFELHFDEEQATNTVRHENIVNLFPINMFVFLGLSRGIGILT